MNRVKRKQLGKQRDADAVHDFRRAASRELKPLEDLTEYVQEYAKQHPETVAIACLGVGFILGWKLKLW